MLGGRWRPRKFGGRISQQARDYVTHATVEQLAAIDYVIDAIETGGEEVWDTIPWSMPPSRYDNLVVVLLTHGDVFVWKGYVDAPQYYSIIYIGPGNLFPGGDATPA